ncbi:class I SAM-dependent methyltransferase [Oscillatoriales cyanobacterium LEGE 11467]|uniref:Class I SAM-dependent methyltransferase n=1 Tax=Zarconia navalis LEGE 11467 TaxID=1828826 RepID=A0A928Z7N6_9CYAN|nr:class I SAM-dependent methyltransferase [Zarconia navalis]MBE9041617.1 class I SAM-dependent methyltransferase [Zarconia navalis LEGE 11467]
MNTQNKNHEYLYPDSNSLHHHTYLISPLIKLLSHVKTPDIIKPRVLDIGCGNGSLSNLIARQGYDVVGIDESESGVRVARQAFPQCQFIQGSIYHLSDLKLESQFDVVISSETIEHLFYPRELVRGARKYLKSNGRLILTTPYHGYLKNLVLAISGKMDRHFTTLWDGGHIKFFSVVTLRSLLESEGFTDIQFEFAGRFPYLWKSMLCSSTFKLS